MPRKDDDRHDDDRHDDDVDETDRDDEDDEDEDEDEEDRPRRRRSARANALRRERNKTRRLEAEIAAIRKNGLGGESDKKTGDVDIDALKAELRSEYEEKLNANTLVSTAIAALADPALGLKARPRRAVRLLDLESVDIVNGQVDEDSLLDAIEALRDDAPELFRRTRPRSDSGSRRSRHDDDDDDDEFDDEADRNTRRSRPSRPARSEDNGSRRSGGRPKRLSGLEQALNSIAGGSSDRR